MAVKFPDVKRGTCLILRTDGTEEVVDLLGGVARLNQIRLAIKAETLDFVRIGRLHRTDLQMAVDDAGYETELKERGKGALEVVCTRARLPVNAKATELYHAICVPGTTHQIVGDVVLFHDDDFE